MSATPTASVHYPATYAEFTSWFPTDDFAESPPRLPRREPVN